MATYSFLDVSATIQGPGLFYNLGAGAGVSEEGITVSAVNDKNTMTIGADGIGTHTLMADKSRLVTVRLLKTSPTNNILASAYQYQESSSRLWGRNTLIINNPATGDSIYLSQVAFKRMPDMTYAKDAGMMEWAFDAINASTTVGSGSPVTTILGAIGNLL